LSRARSANYEPLTPLSFLERSANVFREGTAVVYQDQRYTWPEFAARARAANSGQV